MKRYVSYIILLFSIVIISCDDIIEEDITNDSITIISPLQGADIQGNTVQFRWNGIDGADEYRLQINNNITNTVALDSLITTTLFNYTMNPGTYSWRVRGENFAYVTPFSFDNAFDVVASEDLTNQSVTLISPTNNLVLGAAALPSVFSWQEIEAATSYKIKITRIEGGSELPVFESEDNTIIVGTTTIPSSEFSEDGEYNWTVKAINENSETEFSTPFTFLIDTEKPPVPDLVSPDVGESLPLTEDVVFMWQFLDESGIVLDSIVESNIQISTSADFSANVDAYNVSNATEYTITFGTANTYHWRVRGVDAAGNLGDFSEGRQLIITSSN